MEKHFITASLPPAKRFKPAGAPASSMMYCGSAADLVRAQSLHAPTINMVPSPGLASIIAAAPGAVTPQLTTSNLLLIAVQEEMKRKARVDLAILLARRNSSAPVFLSTHQVNPLASIATQQQVSPLASVANLYSSSMASSTNVRRVSSASTASGHYSAAEDISIRDVEALKTPLPETNFEGDKLKEVSHPGEDQRLNKYQNLLRQQMCYVELAERRNDGRTQGRNKPTATGQVGICCRHCVRNANRTRGAVYFPAKINRMYQAAQNMAQNHLLDACPSIPPEIRAKLAMLRVAKLAPTGSTKKVWELGAVNAGLEEREDAGLFYKTQE